VAVGSASNRACTILKNDETEVKSKIMQLLEAHIDSSGCYSQYTGIRTLIAGFLNLCGFDCAIHHNSSQTKILGKRTL
jgi:hypothetical protein